MAKCATCCPEASAMINAEYTGCAEQFILVSYYVYWGENDYVEVGC